MPRPATRLQFPLQEVAGIQSFMLDVHWLGGLRKKSQLKLLAQAMADISPPPADSEAVGTTTVGSAQRIVAQAAIPIDVVRYLDVWSYVTLGLIGVLTGWALRVLLFAQSKVPAPNLAPEAPREGKITRFIKDHYYLVDALLTATLGVLALLALVNDGSPPDTADSSISAFLIGVALGALTNSELLLKVRR